MRELKKIELPQVHGGMSGPTTLAPQLPRAYWLRNLEFDAPIDPALEMHSDSELRIFEADTSMALLERQTDILRD